MLLRHMVQDKKEIIKMGYKSLGEVMDFLSRIPSINSGGCGISALAMFRWLKKHNSLKNTKFVYFHFSMGELNDNSDALKNGTKLNAPPHCVLMHDYILIDADGEVDEREWGEHSLIIEDESKVVDSINSDDWNPSFEREHWVPIIEKKLGIDLSDVDINIEMW